jgi:hypothetical protein
MAEVDNTTNYAVQELSSRMGNMAIVMGILRQQNDELAEANKLLKKQLKEAIGDAKTDFGTSNQPATANE